jgi:coenzyme F420-reducing hydrogenase delta subunit
MKNKEKNLLRKVKIKLGRVEVEVVSEADDIKDIQKIAEEMAQKIRTRSEDDVKYIG